MRRGIGQKGSKRSFAAPGTPTHRLPDAAEHDPREMVQAVSAVWGALRGIPWCGEGWLSEPKRIWITGRTS